MRNVIWKIRKLPLLTGGVYFEASARENHEGVHAAFLHLCQEVRLFVFGDNWLVCSGLGLRFSSVYVHMLREVAHVIERYQDVMHFEYTKLSGIFTSCGNPDYRLFPTVARSHQQKYRNTTFVLLERKRFTSPHWSDLCNLVLKRADHQTLTDEVL